MTEFVSIVLPVHNQGDHIQSVVTGYREGLRRTPFRYEYLLVVNASRDNSQQKCEELASQDKDVHVLTSEVGGWGRAVRLGLAAAQGNFLCYTNSARTAPQDLLLLSLYAIANPGAVVKAHRKSRESFARKMGSFLYNLECRGLFQLPSWDVNATPKVFSRAVYEKVSPQSNGDLIDLEFYVKCKQNNIPILEVPIYSWSRSSGRSTTNLTTAFGLYSGAYKMWRDLRPKVDPPHE